MCRIETLIVEVAMISVPGKPACYYEAPNTTDSLRKCVHYGKVGAHTARSVLNSRKCWDKQ